MSRTLTLSCCFGAVSVLVGLAHQPIASMQAPEPRSTTTSRPATGAATPRRPTASSTAPSASPNGAATPPAAALDPQAEATRRGTIVAKVGDVTLTVGEIEDQLNAQAPFLRARYRDPERLREFVDNAVRFELLALAAEREGYGEHSLVTRATRQNAVQHLIRTEFDEKITPQSIPEADVRAAYEASSAEFHRPEMRRASHVLVATRAEAEKLIREAKTADAARFRELARTQSLDNQTKLRGGDLRYFTQDGLPPGARPAPAASPNATPTPTEPLDSTTTAIEPALVTAAFALREVGDVVREPIAVGDHFSVLKLTGLRPAETRSFEQAEQGLRLRLWRERRQKALEDFVAALRQRTQPSVDTDLLDRIEVETASPSEALPGFPPGGRATPTPPTPTMPSKSGTSPRSVEGARPSGAGASGEHTH